MEVFIKKIYAWVNFHQQENQFLSKINTDMWYEQMGYRKYKWSQRKNDNFLKKISKWFLTYEEK